MVYTVIAHLYTKEGADIEEKARSKLIEASQVYSKDKGTIAWFVMQDHKDPRAWSIVERYEQESDLATHRANPFYAVFAGYASEFLDKPPEIRFFNELDTSKPAKTE